MFIAAQSVRMMCSRRAAKQPALPSLKRRILPDASCLGEGIALFPVSRAFIFSLSPHSKRRASALIIPLALGHIAHAVLLEENSGKGALAR